MSTKFSPYNSKLSENNSLTQKAFIMRGLASLEAAKKSGEYVSSEVVLRKLDEMLAIAIQKKQK